MRKITIITGEQGSGTTIIAYRLLQQPNPNTFEATSIDAFKKEFKKHGILLDYIVDRVSSERNLLNFLKK